MKYYIMYKNDNNKTKRKNEREKKSFLEKPLILKKIKKSITEKEKRKRKMI